MRCVYPESLLNALDRAMWTSFLLALDVGVEREREQGNAFERKEGTDMFIAESHLTNEQLHTSPYNVEVIRLPASL